MTNIWILSANSSQATIYTASSPIAPLAALETLSHPEARVKQMELTSDRPGRTFDSFGAGRHAKGQEVEPKEQELIRFAKTIAERLEQGRIAKDFERLVVVAAPALLGLLRSHFAAPLKSRVSLEVDKDYTALRADELRARLPERL
jgi:protein required for attachment to host cells